MLTDKFIEEFLQRYFKGELTQEEKEVLFASIKQNPALDDIIQEILRNNDPVEVKEFLSEKALMCDSIAISEEDETMIELYLSGMMEPDEEETFKKKLLSDEEFRNNALAQAFLYKAIQKIRKSDESAIESAKELSESSIRDLFAELKEEDDDELIDNFLKGKLSDIEEESFKNRLKKDIAFKERTSAIVMLNKGIQMEMEHNKKVIENAKNLTKEDIKKEFGTINPFAATAACIPVGNTANTIPLWNNFKRVISIAAVTIAVAGCGIDYYMANSYISNEAITFATKNADLAYSSLPKETHSRGDEADLNQLFDNVKSKQNLAETIKELEDELESGICEDQKRLMLATAYIYNGQKNDAKEMLKKIINDELTQKEFKNKAQELLKSLNNSIFF